MKPEITVRYYREGGKALWVVYNRGTSVGNGKARNRKKARAAAHAFIARFEKLNHR